MMDLDYQKFGEVILDDDHITKNSLFNAINSLDNRLSCINLNYDPYSSPDLTEIIRALRSIIYLFGEKEN